jgi:hypothetical protein
VSGRPESRACRRMGSAEAAERWTMWVRSEGNWVAQRVMREMAEVSSDSGRESRNVE